MAKLTATTYAILGLLERQPWSAYELTKYMQTSGIRAVWPRTESRIYVEFKNLVSHGLATDREETRQGRKRRVYSITAQGRKQLRGWLREPGGGLRLQSEPLLKMLYGDLEPEAAGVQVQYMKSQLVEELQTTRQAIDQVLDKGFFFRENALQNAQLVSLLVDFLEARHHWLGQLDDDRAPPSTEEEITAEAQAIYREQAERLANLLRDQPLST